MLEVAVIIVGIFSINNGMELVEVKHYENMRQCNTAVETAEMDFSMEGEYKSVAMYCDERQLQMGWMASFHPEKLKKKKG